MFDLQGTDAQQQLAAVTLQARCDFPWDLLQPGLRRATGREQIPVEWVDLSRYAAQLDEQRDAGGHGHIHEDGDTADPLEHRRRVLGLAWYSGKISIERTLTGNLAAEVLLAEAAHMVDFFYLNDRQRVGIWNALHPDHQHLPDDADVENAVDLGHGHGWFDVGPYGAWVGECVDEETQALSHRGWVGPDELQAGDEILTFDLDSQTTQWAVVELVNRFPSRPYRIWSHRGAELAVTDNHRWVVDSRGRPGPGPYELVPSSDLRSSHRVPLAAPSGDQPTRPKWEDDLVELVAWTMTEGYYKPNQAYREPLQRGEKRPGRRPGRGGIVITQQVHRARVAALMERLGVPAGSKLRDEGCWQWYISGELAHQVMDIAPNKAPAIGWLRTLTQRQLALFIDVCILGDGFEGEYQGRSLRRGFVQQQGERLDSFLAACALAGQPATRMRTDGDVDTWTLRNSNHTEARRFTPGPYRSGPVWCPTTEVGTFVARRGRTIFITGNSFMEAFVRAFSDVPVAIRLGHPTDRDAAVKVRAAVLGEPLPYYGLEASGVYHDSHRGIRREVEWAQPPDGRRPCRVCRP